MIKPSDEDKNEAILKAFELFLVCLSAGPCDDCVFFDNNIDLDIGPCSIGCPNSWPLFDNATSIGSMNRKVVVDFLHKKESVSKAAQELVPVVDICPCNECSDDVRIACHGCETYYDWVRKLKGERE